MQNASDVSLDAFDSVEPPRSLSCVIKSSCFSDVYCGNADIYKHVLVKLERYLAAGKEQTSRNRFMARDTSVYYWRSVLVCRPEKQRESRTG